MIDAYDVLVVQVKAVRIAAAPTASTATASAARAVTSVREALRNFPGSRLVVLPEYAVTGDFVGAGADAVAAAAITIPGPVIEQLAGAARELDIYLAGAALERDPDAPTEVYNTAFIVSPTGDVILKYRSITGGLAPEQKVAGIRANPTAGGRAEALFPVVDTELGRLGCLVGDDVSYPEISRALTINGAEILIHSRADWNGPKREALANARVARGFENMCYFVSANHSSVGVTPQPLDPGGNGNRREDSESSATFESCGESDVIGIEGRLLARVAGSGETAMPCTIEVEQLRWRRAQTKSNFLAFNRCQVYAPTYLASGGPVPPRAEPVAPIRPYNISCIQTSIRYIQSSAEAAEVIDENLTRALVLSEEAVVRDNAKVLVYPEFFLQGLEYERPVKEWVEHCGIRIPGPELDRISECAAKWGVYIAGEVLEYDPEWPDRFFNTAFIVNDTGKLILRYRKHNGGFNVAYTVPGDIYTEFVERYGVEGLFPVVDTPIGRLGCLVCYDVAFPEVARGLAWNGAEVMIHVTAEPHAADQVPWQRARQTRAYENVAYLAAPNMGMTSGGRMPRFRTMGGSQILDYQGAILARVDTSGEALVTATVNIEALRRYRAKVTPLPDLVDRELFGRMYAEADCLRNEGFANRPMVDRREGRQLILDTIERFYEKGRYVRSDLFPEPVKR